MSYCTLLLPSYSYDPVWSNCEVCLPYLYVLVRDIEQTPVLVLCEMRRVLVVDLALFLSRALARVCDYPLRPNVVNRLAAAAALRAMNGAQLNSKAIVVRLHEPKQLRQEKLAQRYAGHNGHPRSSSGATSPTASDAGETLVGGWSSPRTRSSILGSPKAGYNDRPERGRRGSGSYFHVSGAFIALLFHSHPRLIVAGGAFGHFEYANEV